MDISPITDYLYVGAQPLASDADKLKALGVQLIISMRGSRRPPKALTQPPLNTLWLRSFDTPLTPIPAPRLLKGVQAALPVIEAGGKVLAHCAFGRHRSVVMAAAILIAQGYPAEAAMQLLVERRAFADPKAWYVRPQITRFEQYWRRYQASARQVAPPQPTPLAAVRAILETDRNWAMYALGDLAPEQAPFAEWRISADQTALLLLYRRFGPAVLFALGAPERVRPLLDEISSEREVYLLIRPDILPLIKERYAVRDETAMWRMTLDPAHFQPVPDQAVERLELADVPRLQALFADGQPTDEAPDFFFPEMVPEGVYYSVREGEALMAAAGTHLISTEFGVGAIGNVYTRRDRRGQGLARRVTGAVVAELLKLNVQTVGLNVKQDNLAAQRVYAHLGFRRYCAFYEGIASRR